MSAYLPPTVGRRRDLLGAALIAVALHAVFLGALARWPVASPPLAPAPSLEIRLTTATPEPPAAPAIPTPSLTPVAPATPQPEAEPVPEAAPAPSKKSAEVAPPPRPASASEDTSAASSRETARPSGRALLAQATERVQHQGFVAPDAETTEDPAQRGAVQRYIEAWTRRVQAYGNRHYPAPAALDGQLRIRAVIDREGQLRQAEVIQSSGHPELDQAALQTVREAAPYRPFDRGMGERDSLTITRTWRFGKGNSFGVH